MSGHANIPLFTQQQQQEGEEACCAVVVKTISDESSALKYALCVRITNQQ